MFTVVTEGFREERSVSGTGAQLGFVRSEGLEYDCVFEEYVIVEVEKAIVSSRRNVKRIWRTMAIRIPRDCPPRRRREGILKRWSHAA